MIGWFVEAAGSLYVIGWFAEAAGSLYVIGWFAEAADSLAASVASLFVHGSLEFGNNW